MRNDIVVVTIIVIMSAILVLFTFQRKDGSPGNWSKSDKIKISEKYTLPMLDTPIFTFLANTIIEVMVSVLSETYHIKVLSLDLSTSGFKKLCDKTLGSIGEWNRDLQFKCENEIAKNLPRECASCIMKQISKRISPYGFLTLAEKSSREREGMGSMATLLMILQLSLKRCPDCAV